MQSTKDGLKHYNYQCNPVSFMKNFIKKGCGAHKLYLAGLEEEKRIEAELKKQKQEDKEKKINLYMHTSTNNCRNITCWWYGEEVYVAIVKALYGYVKKSEEDLHKNLAKDIQDNSKRCVQNQSEDNAKKCAQNQSEDNSKKCMRNQSEEESCLDGWDEDEGNCYYCGTASSSKWHSECRKLFFGGIVAAFSCNFCKMKFKGKRSLTYHKMTHTGDGVICGFCGKLLFGKKSVNYHKQKHTSHRSHKCSICFKAYHSNRYLLQHMNIHTGQTQKYLCHTCGLFCSKTRYYTHIRMHSNVKNYICDKCGKSFTRYNELNSHLISHSSDINYNCAVCNKGTKTRTMLMHHIKTKHPQTMGLPETLGWPQKFPCSICNKKLSCKNTLTMHMQMHRGEKNYQCTICSKRLSTKTGLNMHIKIHKGEKNYQCTICSKKFLHKPYLMKHSISHTRERNYKCDLCDKTYMYPNDLAKHKSSVHSKKKTKK
uniref:C2H2-type domain-containing protein n=1 Tax=Timema cristinae TaxID=61476 RepID=A0A7R9D3I8_TIMCR|nr:unnamed protein product [Timema cristinae]